jgi:hypothetical protein
MEVKSSTESTTVLVSSGFVFYMLSELGKFISPLYDFAIIYYPFLNLI